MTYPKQSTISHHENANNINLIYTIVAIDDGKKASITIRYIRKILCCESLCCILARSLNNDSGLHVSNEEHSIKLPPKAFHLDNSVDSIILILKGHEKSTFMQVNAVIRIPWIFPVEYNKPKIFLSSIH